MARLAPDAPIGGVINNKYPCCQRATQLHDILQYADGDEIVRQCKKDGRKWKITFRHRVIGRMPKPVLKLEWEEIGGRSANATNDVDSQSNNRKNDKDGDEHG